MLETCASPLLSTPASEAEKKECKPSKKRKAKREHEIIAKITMKKKKLDEKKAILLNELETNDLHIKRIKLNLNFRKHVLFDQLPYLAHLENPAIVDVVKNGIVENLSLEKYLLATGLLKDSIQDSLNMIVPTNGKLSNAAVRRQLDMKFPSVMRKPYPIDAVFKDKANLTLKIL